MRLLFLCGSLESGYDGVGDYVRRLSGELIRQNHQVMAIALNDNHVYEQRTEIQNTEGILVPVYRFSSASNYNLKFKIISSLVANFKPDWISFQYVGFSYSRYGLPYYLIYKVWQTKSNTKLHIMLHELWCGMDEFSGKKEKLLGAFQKIFLKMMLEFLKPAMIFTNIDFYGVTLEKIGVKALTVPVFGNIPFEELDDDKDLSKLLAECALNNLYDNREKWLVACFFGTVYSCPGLHELLFFAAGAAAHLGKRFGILFIGKNRQNKFDISTIDIPKASCWHTGQISSKLIHQIIKLSDIGILTSPSDRINKSGSGNAFLERGIPLVVSKDDRTYSKEIMESEGIYQIKNSADIVSIVSGKYKSTIRSRLASASDAYGALNN